MDNLENKENKEKIKILIVDDDDINLFALRLVLNKIFSNIELIEAING